MKPNTIKPLAICLFRDGSRIFAGEGFDTVKKQTFYRPLGGTIEFGERAEDTVVREMMEETGEEVTGIRYLKTIENFFTFEGIEGHEIVLVFDGSFVDKEVYKKEFLVVTEGVTSERAYWRESKDFKSGKYTLYPGELLEIL